MSVLAANGILIGYDEYGSGTPLVLVHGHPFNRSMWRDQVEAFSSTYRVIVPDLRGYGETSVIPGKTTMEDMAKDLAALLDALAIDRVILGGLSMGGQIVFEFYYQFPERVSALLLADTQAQAETDGGKVTRNATAQRIIDQGMQSLVPEMLPKLLSARTFAEHPEVVEKVRQMIVKTPPEGAAAALRGRAERRDYIPLLKSVAVPALIVVGSEDEYTPIRDAELMHRGIVGSQLATFPGIGHMPNMECPDEFNTTFRRFLHSLPSTQMV